MFEHALNARKGWFQPAALDYSTKLSTDVTFTPSAGRVVHLNAAAEFEMGVGETDMGIFLLQGEDAYDVGNTGTTASGNFMHQAIIPAGDMSGLVATGAYELDSTEFDTTRDYVPNDLLTAGPSNPVIATGGVLTNAGSGAAGDVQQFVDPVCGVVSKGSFNNEHGINVLAFWPVWLPGSYSGGEN
jgi:hypothetical protein